MAAPMNQAVPAPALNQKQRRALLKKERRKRKRQAIAKASGLQERGEEHSGDEEEDEDADSKAEEERQRQEWLERERLAQEEFRLRTEREEVVKKRLEEEERRIKEEWEAQQRREQEEKEHKLQEKKDREEAVKKMLDQAESQLANGGPWMNTEPPDFGTEKDRANCPFFIKTGACRFGDRCSRKHEHPASSLTLLVRGMFVAFGLEQSRRDDYDTDASLEFSEEEIHQQFLEFYQDVLPEFRSVGKVVQFKVSCNYEPHLRGNVYVQFDTEDQCREAFVRFNGRWYAGRQLQCEFCPVTRWKTAICGLFDKRKCPKGKHCNFLHVFNNPGYEFWEADRDLHMSPDRGGSYMGRWSERRDRDRDWGSWRSSVPGSERSHSRRGELRSRERRRSRSRERSRREGRSRSRERRSRSRERSRREERSRERSRERRSRSREKRTRERCREVRAERRSDMRDKKNGSKERKSRSREKKSWSREKTGERKSRSKEKSKSRERKSWSEERKSVSRERKSWSDDESGERKNGSMERKSKSRESKSKSKERKSGTTDDIIPPQHHKHSKKSKKKKSKKKKHKKKKHLSPGDTSCSGQESGDEGDVGVDQGSADQSSSPLTSHTEMADIEAAETEVVGPGGERQVAPETQESGGQGDVAEVAQRSGALGLSSSNGHTALVDIEAAEREAVSSEGQSQVAPEDLAPQKTHSPVRGEDVSLSP